MNDILKTIGKKWSGYKYRFLPWIMLKFPSSNVTKMEQCAHEQEKLLEKVVERLSLYQATKQSTTNQINQNFTLQVSKSSINDAGMGVFLSRGFAPQGTLVAFYPGTVYMPSDSKFFQSLNNPFLFRCSDGICIDGKSTGMSKSIYKSCGMRDNMGRFKFCDFTWLDPHSSDCCFLNTGQFVNNQNQSFQQNVEYLEVDVPHRTLPLHLRKFFPNINYCNLEMNFVRTVVLVATRDIFEGEELFSNYFTVVKTL